VVEVACQWKGNSPSFVFWCSVLFVYFDDNGV
jgi:hypothetical protein